MFALLLWLLNLPYKLLSYTTVIVHLCFLPHTERSLTWTFQQVLHHSKDGSDPRGERTCAKVCGRDESKLEYLLPFPSPCLFLSFVYLFSQFLLNAAVLCALHCPCHGVAGDRPSAWTLRKFCYSTGRNRSILLSLCVHYRCSMFYYSRWGSENKKKNWKEDGPASFGSITDLSLPIPTLVMFPPYPPSFTVLASSGLPLPFPTL